MRRLLSMLLASALLLTACGSSEKPDKNPPAEEPKEEIQEEKPDILDSKRDYDFNEFYKKQDDAAYQMVFDAPKDSNCKIQLSMDIIEGYGAEALPSSQNAENYYFVNKAKNVAYATARFYTAPADLEEFYNTKDKDEILLSMKSTYFPIKDIHDGLLKNASVDFGYTIPVDWTGKIGDYEYSLIEFIDEEAKNHAIRFVMGNSEMNENYWSFEYRADLPMDDEQLLNDHRALLYSLTQI